VVRAPTRRYLAGKRALDLVVCTLLLVIAIPVIAVCALAIRLDTSGPMMYAQLRTGRDGRRFRMLIELAGGAAHEEDTWVGGRIGIGGAVLLISAPVPRCAITTQDPDTGERDLDTLRTIIAYRGLTNDHDIDFGVYGEVEQPGRIRVGDSVEVLTAAPAAAAAS